MELNHPAWVNASDAEREAFVDHLLSRIDGFEQGGLFTFADSATPTAVFVHAFSGIPFVYVPGAVVTVGFSPEEVAGLALAQAAEGEDASYEQWGQLLEQLPSWPAKRVTVPGMLVARAPLSGKQFRNWLPAFEDSLTGDCSDAPGAHAELAQVELVLTQSGFALPDPAAWEHACRGGRTGWLLSLRQTPPNEAWIEAQLGFAANAALDPASNPFGVAFAGLYPELCSDPTQPGGQQPVRGGAADLYPWQGCGEWHLLCAALGTDTQAHEFGVSLRPVVIL